MTLELLIGLGIILAAIVVALFVFKKPFESYIRRLGGEIAEGAARTAEEKVREMHREERERMDEKFHSKEQLLEEKMRSGDKTLRENRDSIKDMVEKIGLELREHQKKLHETEKDRTDMFGVLRTQVQQHSEIAKDLKGSTDDLKNILSNNQLRGRYGEEVAENLLQVAGFVKGQNYVLDTSQDTTSSRPDVTVFLPDKTKINVDVKFPFKALLNYQATDDKAEQQRYLKQFEADVKQKVKEVTTRDYINPEEGTVDFVVLFVPNEMIFSFIYDRLNDVWNDALQKKVVLAGPFNFTAMLRMVYQAHKNFTYQENMHTIIKLVKTFEQEWEKFNGSIDKLGKNIETVNNQYRTVSTTRTNQLNRVIDKIKGEELLPEATHSAIEEGEQG